MGGGRGFAQGLRDGWGGGGEVAGGGVGGGGAWGGVGHDVSRVNTRKGNAGGGCLEKPSPAIFRGNTLSS